MPTQEDAPMNAAEQVTSPEVASKLAALVNRFQDHFPKVQANLKPWTNDPDTQNLIDPDSMDIGLNLPVGNTLVQLRFQGERLIGIEMICFGLFGSQRWKFSTIGNWSFLGSNPPPPGFQQTLKRLCQEVFLLFNGCEAFPEF